MRVLECQYCGKFPKLVTGLEIYPHRQDLSGKYFYLCEPCKAYVGCHPHSKRPLGSVANSELRSARSVTHGLFDPIWKTKRMSRSAAYRWLSWKLDIKFEDAHIALLNVEQCKRVWQLVRLLNEEDK